MSKKKRLIIPVFIPFGGCPERCVFCDQKGITGSMSAPTDEDVKKTMDEHLATWKGSGVREVAFYGGSFTALSAGLQKHYLTIASDYASRGLIDSIRVSTRPDCIDGDVMSRLKAYGVETVELGAQSFSDEVLRRSGRSHTAADTARAVSLLKESGFKAGLQLMPGLPGDTPESAVESAKAAASLAPGFVRVYPALVLKGTEMAQMVRRKEYAPWALDDMVRVCAEMLGVFTDAGITVARMGLQPSAELMEKLAGGPFHPSFRQLVEKAALAKRSA